MTSQGSRLYIGLKTDRYVRLNSGEILDLLNEMRVENVSAIIKDKIKTNRPFVKQFCKRYNLKLNRTSICQREGSPEPAYTFSKNPGFVLSTFENPFYRINDIKYALNIS